MLRTGELMLHVVTSHPIAVSSKTAGTAASALLLLLLSCSPQTREASFLKRGKFYLEKHEYERAALEFRNAQRLMPKDAEPYYHAGLAYIGQRNTGAAYQSFSKAIQLNPKHRDAQVRLAELLNTTGKEKYLQEAEQHSKAALAVALKDPDALSALAISEIKLGRPAAAELYLRQVLEKFPRHLRSSMSLAIIKLSQNEFAAAEEILKEAVAKAPLSVEARIGLSELYGALHKLDDAERPIRRALEIDPRSGTALLFLARVQQAKGQEAQIMVHYV